MEMMRNGSLTHLTHDLSFLLSPNSGKRVLELDI